MAHPKKLRAEVRRKYIDERQSIAIIATFANVSVGTIKRWKKEDQSNGKCWDRARAAITTTDRGKEDILVTLIEDFVVLFQASMDDIKTAKDLAAIDKAKMLTMLADSFSKTMSAAGKASPQLSKLGIAIDVIRTLSDFIQKEFPQHFETFVDILEPFGQILSVEYE
ncbi:MAG: DUF1804 family protein [Rhizobiales bacterium]|nr:DUF1804 family protein [Hyphomicrobiales bacterium]